MQPRFAQYNYDLKCNYCIKEKTALGHIRLKRREKGQKRDGIYHIRISAGW